MTTCEAVKEVVWLCKLLASIKVVPNMDKPIKLYYNNSGAVTTDQKPKSHKRAKRIKRKYHLIRETIQIGE